MSPECLVVLVGAVVQATGTLAAAWLMRQQPERPKRRSVRLRR